MLNRKLITMKQLSENLKYHLIEGDQNTDDENKEDTEEADEQTTDEKTEDIEKNAQSVQSASGSDSLILDDGTDTPIPVNTQNAMKNNPETNTGDNINIDIESNHGGLPPKEGIANISFADGEFNVQQITPQVQTKIKLINQTFLPLLEKSLIELLGNSGAYKRENCQAVETNGKIDVELIYHVSAYVGNDISQEALIKEQNYIYNTIKVVPNVTIRNLRIDTQNGDVKIGITV